MALCGAAEQRLIHHLPFRSDKNFSQLQEVLREHVLSFHPQVTTPLTATAAAGSKVQGFLLVSGLF